MKVIDILKPHSIVLQGQRVLMRPLTEDDSRVLVKWNRDPQILYFTEGDAVAEYRPEEVQEIYRSISRHALCFIIERGGVPIRECGLQEMNLERILSRRPGRDCRRIDLMMGDKTLWSQGIGTEVINLLSQFGFEMEAAEAIFACDIANYNLRSLKAFQNAGFEEYTAIPQSSTDKAHYR